MAAALPNLFIDWLSTTIEIDAGRVAEVQNSLDHYEQWHDDLRRRPGRGVYANHYTLLMPNGSSVDIYTAPRKNGYQYLKLEYSPNNIGQDGPHSLADLLAVVLGENYRSNFYEAQVNRVDITFDVHRIYVADLWVQDMRTRSRKSAIIRSPSSQTQTLYLGYGGVSRQLLIYDKNAEQGLPAHRTPWVRIEYRYSKGDHRLSDLSDNLRNPFDGFLIRRYKPIVGRFTPAVSRAIFDALRLRGDGRGAGEDQDLTRYVENFPYWHVWTRRNAIWSQLRTRISQLMPPELD